MTDEVKKASEIIKEGGIILYPTDTIWGIGCDATNDNAVKKIYAVKKREDTRSMLVLLDKAEKLNYYTRKVPEIAWQLIEVSDAPLTIVYPDGRNLAPSLLAEDGSIGIRITSDPFCSELIKKTGTPLVSTSANFSGQSFPSVFNEIDEEIRKSVDYIVQWRKNDNKKGKPSQVIKLEEGGVFRILRR